MSAPGAGDGNADSMTQKVSFAAMEYGVKADYSLLDEYGAAERASLADRVLALLKLLDGESPYRISRLEHCLQTATRAERDGADDQTVVCALLHDIGDALAPDNHSQLAACEALCSRWDQASFDPDYESMPLEHFAARVRALFLKAPMPQF